MDTIRYPAIIKIRGNIMNITKEQFEHYIGVQINKLDNTNKPIYFHGVISHQIDSLMANHPDFSQFGEYWISRDNKYIIHPATAMTRASIAYRF
jgi:hypothetical protein